MCLPQEKPAKWVSVGIVSTFGFKMTGYQEDVGPLAGATFKSYIQFLNTQIL